MDGVVPKKVGYQYWFADKNFLDGRTIRLSVVAPRYATHAPLKHTKNEFFFILECSAEFYLNSEAELKNLVIQKYEMNWVPN